MCIVKKTTSQWTQNLTWSYLRLVGVTLSVFAAHFISNTSKLNSAFVWIVWVGWVK